MDIYQFALDIQDGVNLSGIVKSWAQATSIMWDEARALGRGTQYVNAHPVNVLVLDKLGCLAQYPNAAGIDAYSDCYRLCAERAGKGFDAVVAQVKAAYEIAESEAGQ